jgi:enediyne biosynthesis protein E4
LLAAAHPRARPWRAAAPILAVLATAGALVGASPAKTGGWLPFVDRAGEWGLDFTYRNGATGRFYYPEAFGGGAALFDFDNDSDLDVFLVQGRVLEPGAPPLAGPAGGRLFRNDLVASGVKAAAPRFVDVTAASGIRAHGYGMGVAAGDVDNDGWVDLYLANYGPNQLWRNNGDGTFGDATAASGVGDPGLSVGAAFGDLDRDGWLDLYVVDYVEFVLADAKVCHGWAGQRDYCGPTAYRPVPGRLYRNRGDGTFADVTLSSGVGRKVGTGMAAVAADLDADGWADLFVANDLLPNFLWRNRGDWTFDEVGLQSGAAVNAEGKAEANMGIALGDFDADGDDDLHVTHFDREANTLWVNLGGGQFADGTARAGLAAPTLPFTSFGTGWIDVDNDGWLDLAIANGAVTIVEERARAGDPFPYGQPHQLFRNLGGGRFVEVSGEMGELFRRPEVGRGLAFGDLDNDGDGDALLVNCNGPTRLWINQTGDGQPWLGLRLVGRPPRARGERDLLGARVELVRRGGPALWRRAASDGSYASANDPRVLFGLGGAGGVGGVVVEVRVHWPDGAIESFPPPPPQAYTTLRQGDGRKPGAGATEGGR